MLLSLRWLVALLGFLGILLAVLGFLALLGWGIYLVADHQRAYEIFLAGAAMTGAIGAPARRSAGAGRRSSRGHGTPRGCEPGEPGRFHPIGTFG
jgi:hypothetical protein